MSKRNVSRSTRTTEMQCLSRISQHAENSIFILSSCFIPSSKLLVSLFMCVKFLFYKMIMFRVQCMFQIVRLPVVRVCQWVHDHNASNVQKESIGKKIPPKLVVLHVLTTLPHLIMGVLVKAIAPCSIVLQEHILICHHHQNVYFVLEITIK